MINIIIFWTFLPDIRKVSIPNKLDFLRAFNTFKLFPDVLKAIDKDQYL